MSKRKNQKLQRIVESLSEYSEDELEKALATLQRKAGEDSDDSQPEPEFEHKPRSVEHLVALYHKRQKGLKASKPEATRKSPPRKKPKTKMFSLNFCRYRRTGLAYRRTSGNIQISGFCDSNNYTEVVTRAAHGLSIKANAEDLQLVVSGGAVVDAPLHSGNLWTLGGYVEEIGGVSARGKKTFGIYVPYDVEETSESGEDLAPKKAKKGITRPQEKAECSSVTHSPPGTQHNPICIGDTSPHHIQVCLDERMIAKYCPVKDGVVCTSVMLTGREGVHRLQHFDFDTSDGSVQQKISADLPPMQPEYDNAFLLVELCICNTTYLKAAPLHGQSVNICDMVFDVKPKLLSSQTSVTHAGSDVPLLVISPKHGKLPYIWERSAFSTWQRMDVPANTCLVYVRATGTYRCRIGEDTVTFRVTEDNSQKGDGLMVNIDKIEFGDVIGRGNFGVVHRGKWSGKDVALKTIKIPPGYDPDTISSYREIAVLRQLHHPNIVSLLGCSVSNEEVVLIMNFVDGNNLAQLLFGKSKYKDFTDEKALYIASKVTEAVLYMHHHDPIVIHQDIKPQNVLVTNDLKEVFVCDMGVTKLKQASEATVTCTAKGPGTYPYMAPEMFKKAKRSVAVDIYSLGCLFLELFTRRRVWPGLDSMQIMMKVCGSFDCPPCMPDLSDLCTKYREVCGSCLQLNYVDRPNIDEVKGMVAKIAENTS